MVIVTFLRKTLLILNILTLNNISLGPPIAQATEGGPSNALYLDDVYEMHFLVSDHKCVLFNLSCNLNLLLNI